MVGFSFYSLLPFGAAGFLFLGLFPPFGFPRRLLLLLRFPFLVTGAYSGASPNSVGTGILYISVPKKFSICLNLVCSVSLTKVIAHPSLLARAVRPIRCT